MMNAAETANVSAREDLHLIAQPTYVEPPSSIGRLNNTLAERWGRSATGLPNFRLIDARSAMVPRHGRYVMRYPHPNEPVEPESTCYIRIPGQGLLPVPDDPRDYPPELEQYSRLPVGVEVLLRQKGLPYWVMEGWRPAHMIGADWDEQVSGPVPREGDYTYMWSCKTERGGYRDPNDSDIDEIARRVALQAESPTLKDARWEEGWNPTRFNDRVDMSRTAEEEKREKAGDEFEEEVEKYLQDHRAKIVTDTAAILNNESKKKKGSYVY